MGCSGKRMSLLQKAEWKHFAQIICTRTAGRLISLSLPLKTAHKLLWTNPGSHAVTQKEILTAIVIIFFQVKWLCTTRSKTTETKGIEALYFDYIQDGKCQQNIRIHIYVYIHTHAHVSPYKYKLVFITKIKSRAGRKILCVNISTLKWFLNMKESKSRFQYSILCHK